MFLLMSEIDSISEHSQKPMVFDNANLILFLIFYLISQRINLILKIKNN